ncbi:MAG: hypothetical protein P1S60_14340 [Anaerolineae bacterium]|nr:hypothetical protein [Anaerolineae bacterium]
MVDKWYHGSPLRLSILRTGSTITKNRHLARIFSHKPEMVSIDDQGRILHNGGMPGYLYQIAECVAPEDVRPHPRTTMRPGDEWLINRPLKVTLICKTEPDSAELLKPEIIAQLKTDGKI